jgi:hypothetical protein
MRGPTRPNGSAPSGFRRFEWAAQLLFVAAHIPLATLIPSKSPYVKWHAFAVLAVGVLFALRRARFEGVACVVAYLTGAEVFWRMRRTDLPWEFGKYAVVLVVLIALVRTPRPRRSWLPIAYFALLVPSAILTFTRLEDAEARDQLSFNLSGPLALALCTAFFHSVRFSKREFRWIFASLVGPVVSIGWTAAVILEQRDLQQWVNESNIATSGGFGPNQVSAVLGLGILAAVLWLIVGTGNTVGSGAVILITLFLFRQCVITFSRGGIYMAVGGICAAAFYLARDQRTRARLLMGAGVILPIIFFVVWPRLESMTSGVIGQRFSDTRLTGRGLLVQADLDSWSKNLLIGVGPGMGGENRLRYLPAAAAHTEYSRMVAEHGTLGFIAIVLLGVIAVRNIRSAPTRLDKALAAGLIAYALLSMVVDGMRLVQVAFAFGLSGAHLVGPPRSAAKVAPVPRRIVRTRLASEA